MAAGDAFIRAMEMEMQGVLEDEWYDFLRWIRTERYGDPDAAAALRQEARERAARREVPPWPDFSSA